MNTQRFLYVPYQLVRLPLTTVDMKVMSRMPVDAAPRRAFDLLLGTADVLAGRVLHSPDLQRAGAARLSQPARMSQPAPTSQPAATRPRPGPSAPEPDTAPEPATAESDTAEPDTAAVSVTTDEVEAEVEQLEEAAREQVVEDAAAKEHDTARSNQNVSTIRQGLRQEEVAAEVRAKRAEKRAAERARAGSD